MAEEKLSRDGEQFRLFFENGPEYCYMISPEGTVRDVNRAALEALGYQKGELLGKHVGAIYAPECHARMKKLFGKWHETGRLDDEEMTIITKGGEKRTVLLSAAAVRDGDGEILHSVSVQRDITELKRAQEETRKARDDYLAIANLTGDIIVHLDKDGRWTFLNDGACEFWGGSREELTGTAFADCLHPDDKEKTSATIQEMVRSRGLVKGFVNRQKTPRGWRAVEWNAAPVFDDRGRYSGMQVTGRDITERERAVEASRIKDRAVSSSINAIAFAEPEGNLTYVNPSFVRLWGYSEESEVLGRPAVGFWEMEKKAAEVIRALRNRGSWIGELVARKKDGSLFDVQLSASMVADENGKPVCMMASFVDITERKRAEEALRQSEERFRALTESTSDWVWEVDADGVYTYASPRVRDLLGYQPEEVLGRIPFDLMPPEEAERVRAVFLESAESHKAFANLENLNLTKDGRVVVLETSGIPFFDSDGRLCGYRGIDRDITERKKSEEHERTRERLEGELAERKRTEEMLLAYQERLRSLASELSRTEERGRRQIAAELHDRIGQPLALIKINLGKACQSGISPDQEEALRAIREQVEETIQDARSLTFELSPPVLYELGLIPAVEWLVEQTREQGGIAIDLEDDGQPKPLSEGIRAALFRIIRELLVNVIKHAQASAASVRLERDGGIVRVTVEDDGIGFDPSEVELRSGPMAGFGLFSIRERLSHIGGDMRIEAGPGKGTRVVALAPLERE